MTSPAPETSPADPEKEALRARLAHYRRFVGALAKHRCKNTAWGTAMAWAPQDLLDAIAADLATKEERDAFRRDMP